MSNSQEKIASSENSSLGAVPCQVRVADLLRKSRLSFLLTFRDFEPKSSDHVPTCLTRVRHVLAEGLAGKLSRPAPGKSQDRRRAGKAHSPAPTPTQKALPPSSFLVMDWEKGLPAEKVRETDFDKWSKKITICHRRIDNSFCFVLFFCFFNSR